MEHAKALRAKKILDEIDSTKSQLSRFNDTSEFCKIKVIGEDGNEHKNEFHFEEDELVLRIRRTITDYYTMKISSLELELQEL